VKRLLPALRDRRAIGLGVLIAAVVMAVPLIVAVTQFRQDRMIEGLQGMTKCDVSVSSSRRLLFPRPGMELRGVRFSRGTPVAETPRLRIEGSWAYLLTFQKRLAHVDAQDLRVVLPEMVPPPRPYMGTGKKTLIENLTAHGAELNIRGGQFAVSRLHLTDVNGDGPTGIRTTIKPPHPRQATLDVDGQAGPFQKPLGQIAIKGAFRLAGAQLAEYKGLAGTLNGKGNFEGLLAAVRVTGEAVATQFEVNSSGHPLTLRTKYDADVNGETGEVQLQHVSSSFGRTTLAITGKVNEDVTELDFDSKSARIEDLLIMFTKSDTPALRAPIVLRAHVELPHDRQPFLRRLRLDGRFRIDNAVWGKSRTQVRVNSLSARAQGDTEEAESGSAERVQSDLAGSVTLRNGTAQLKDVTFRVPGAVARGGGIYNLQSKHLNLQGVVRMEANVSEATSGFKSVLLKPFNFIFRKKDQGKRGATLPVSIVGTYPRPRYRAGLTR
jgi:hypothetical protein